MSAAYYKTRECLYVEKAEGGGWVEQTQDFSPSLHVPEFVPHDKAKVTVDPIELML